MRKYSVDFHTHSNYSPCGNLSSVSYLLEEAKNNGISILSITDHDTFDQIQQAIDLAKEYNIKIVPGFECSSIFENGEKNIETHVLGYSIKYGEGEKEKLQKLIEESSIQISRNGKEKRIPKIKNAIDFIHKIGGVAILAHPMRVFGYNVEELSEILKILFSYGLDGVEVFYSNFVLQNKEENYYTNIIKDLFYSIPKGKIITAGSDHHGYQYYRDNVGEWDDYGIDWDLVEFF